jgi:hypothetical protein
MEQSSYEKGPRYLVSQTPNLIGYGTLTLATIDQGTPELTVVYPVTKVDHFNFFSLFYGCALPSEKTVAGVPPPCTVTVTGIDKTNNQVAQQDYKTNTDGGLNEQMVEAWLVGLTGLQVATFSRSGVWLQSL